MLNTKLILRVLLGFILMNLPLCALAQSTRQVAFPEITQPYFVDRYGLAKSSKNVSKFGFLHPKRGNVEVKGPFSVRDFRHGDLRIVAVFNLPSLKLAGVKYSLNRSWTPEQIQAALSALGTGWKPYDGNIAFKAWQTQDGTIAISILNSLEIQSASVVEAIAKEVAAKEAARKAVPKF